MKKTINNLIKKIAGESDQIINSLSYPRLSTPLKVYPYAIKYQRKLLTKDEIKIPKQVLPYLKKENINQWQGKLTKSQQHGANKAISAFSRQSDKLIWAVTGSGKTEIMFPVITQALAQGKRVCVASPRADVVKEFKLRVEPVFKK